MAKGRHGKPKPPPVPAPTLVARVNRFPVPSDYIPPGTVIARLSATWSDGSPFSGSFIFAAPHGNAGGALVIVGDQLVVNSGGSGLTASAVVTIEAMQ